MAKNMTDSFLTRLFIAQDPFNGQWEAQLYTDDGRGNGDLIAKTNVDEPDPFNPLAQIRLMFAEWNMTHPELDVELENEFK